MQNQIAKMTARDRVGFSDVIDETWEKMTICKP
jgi:hypothetical protein